MAKLKNVRFRAGRLYTIVFTTGTLCFCEYVRFDGEILYFKVIGSTAKDDMLFPGKIVVAKKEHCNKSWRIRNMNKTELVLYGQSNKT